MNKYRALIGAILRVLVIIAMWVWFEWAGERAGSGSLGLLVLVLPLLAISTVLFTGAILRLNDFLLLRRWERGNVTENTPKVKTHKSTASIVAQSSVVGITVWMSFYAVGWISSLIIAAVFTGLNFLMNRQ